ncbi:MAG: hypothetical protein NTU41_12745 [Chloroflexi bacterium]|nr:hypothetical protein [Chloroflexota bacterium]
MDKQKLNRITEKIQACRKRGGIRAAELESIARELGRAPSKRGKEPTWVNERFRDLRPLSIPRHGSRDLNRYTAGAILDQLELDLERWEEAIEGGENAEGD